MRRKRLEDVGHLLGVFLEGLLWTMPYRLHVVIQVPERSPLEYERNRPSPAFDADHVCRSNQATRCFPTDSTIPTRVVAIRQGRNALYLIFRRSRDGFTAISTLTS